MMYLTYCTHPRYATPGDNDVYERFPPSMRLWSFVSQVHEQKTLTFKDLVKKVRDLTETLVAGADGSNNANDRDTMQAIMVYSFLAQHVRDFYDTISIRYE